MRRKNYPPAVSLTPALTKVVGTRLHRIKHTTTFPGSAQKLKTELDTYEKNLQDATSLGSTATSGLPPQREN